MKALLNQDKVVKFTVDKKGTEVGNLPERNIGLSRLRFNGTRLVDVLTLDEFFVTRQLSLHAIEIPGSQKVKMFYRDKYRLINDNGTIRLKTDQEIENEEQKRAKEKKRLQIKRKLKKELGHNEEVINELIKFVLNNDEEARNKLVKYLEIIDEKKA